MQIKMHSSGKASTRAKSAPNAPEIRSTSHASDAGAVAQLKLAAEDAFPFAQSELVGRYATQAVLEAMPVERAPQNIVRTVTPGSGIVQGVFVNRGVELSAETLRKFASAIGERHPEQIDEFYAIAAALHPRVDIEQWLPPSIGVLQHDDPSNLTPRFRRKLDEPEAVHSGAAASAGVPDAPLLKRSRSHLSHLAAASAAAAPVAASAMDSAHFDASAADAAEPVTPHRARAMIWNMNHFGRRNAANAGRLDQKKAMLGNLMQAGPDVVLLNEVNAGVDELQREFPDSSPFAFNPGPRMQALGKADQGTQIEHFPLIYDRRRYRLLRTLIVTPTGVRQASGDDFQWQKPENRSAEANADVYPAFRPFVVYCLGMAGSESKEEHWYGAVHTTPDGDEFRRTSIFQDQVRAAMAHISKAAHTSGARLFIGGDYYLTPEAVVVGGARNAERNVADPPTTAQFGLTQAVHDPDSSLSGEAPASVAAIKAAMSSTVAAPVFETNRKDAHAQVADLAVVAGWTSHRELLPNLQSPAHPQNVDAMDRRFSRPMYEVSDHLPVLFDLSSSDDPLDAFQPGGAHPDAQLQLRRTMNRALVLRTLTIAVQSQASAASAAESKAAAPPALSGRAKYADVLQAKLKLLGRMQLRERLAAVDGSVEPAALIEFLKIHFPEAVHRAGATDLSEFDFETYPT